MKVLLRSRAGACGGVVVSALDFRFEGLAHAIVLFP